MKRSLCLAVALIVASAGLIVGAGQSDAAPQLPRIGITGDTMGTFGDHSYCRGVLHVGLTAAPSKRGVVRVTLTSSGFIGNGPSWKRKPVCKLLIGTVHTSVEAYAKWNFFNADFGPRRGQKVVQDVRTGSGVVEFLVSTYARNNPIRLRQSVGVSYHMLVS